MTTSRLLKFADLWSRPFIFRWMLPGVLFFTAVAPAAIPAQTSTAGPSPAAHSREMNRKVPRAAGYLPDGQIDFLTILPPYPALDSQEDQVDVATLRAWQQPADSARWRLAEDDAQLSYTRFGTAFGTPIERGTLPLLAHLLDRVETDITSALNGSKRYYNRPRPYQRFQVDHVCEIASPPAPDITKGGNSYPSGHSAFGWAVAMALARVAPERSQAILARGREYAESRIVCAVHYPSDVQAAQVLVSAIIGQIETQSEFKRDLSCAQQEYAVANHSRNQMNAECLALKEESAKDR